MRQRCAFVHEDGRQCGRWPQQDSRFCYHHKPRPQEVQPKEGEVIPPYSSLSEPEEAFALIREAIMAVRMGRMSQREAYTLGYLIQTWIQLHSMVKCTTRKGYLAPEGINLFPRS